jgi:phosphoribosylformylglycinamidine synthase
MEVKAPNDLIYIVGQTFEELGGSEYYKLKGHLGKTVPIVRPNQAKKTFRAITKAIDSGVIKACHDVSEGGLAVSAAEMAFSGGYGMELDLCRVPMDALNRDDFVLFSESNSRFLVEVTERARSDFEAVMEGRAHALIGKVTRTAQLRIRGLTGKVIVNVSIKDMLGHWKQTLSSGV